MPHRSLTVWSLCSVVLAVTFALAGLAQAHHKPGHGGWTEPQLTLSLVNDLQFGTIVPHHQSPGTVRVRPNRNHHSQCSQTLTCLEGGSRAQFQVTGSDTRFAQITLPDTAILQNTTGQSMTVERFRLHARGIGTGTGRGKLKAGETVLVGVGADLVVQAQQAMGVYRGTFEIEVVYE